MARGLPRGALVEFQCNLHTGRRSGSAQCPEAVDDEAAAELKFSYAHSATPSNDVHWEVCETNATPKRDLRAVVFVHREPDKLE